MNQRLYEGMFLFDSNLASRDWPGLERHVEDLLKKNSAELVYSERWPDRKMAFDVKGCKKGTYYLTYFNATAASLPGLERDCQLSDRVLRLLVVRDEGLEEDMEQRRSRQLQESESSEEAQKTAARETVARETVARETVARETVARETVARETVARETVARETVAQETEVLAGEPSSEAEGPAKAAEDADRTEHPAGSDEPASPGS